jgi:hypothetical protein
VLCSGLNWSVGSKCRRSVRGLVDLLLSVFAAQCVGRGDWRWWTGVHLVFSSSRRLQLDCPDVAIFVDRVPVLLGFASLKVHGLFAKSAAWSVGHGASWEETVNAYELQSMLSLAFASGVIAAKKSDIRIPESSN